MTFNFRSFLGAFLFATTFFVFMIYGMFFVKKIIQFPIRTEVLDQFNGLNNFGCSDSSRYGDNYYTCLNDVNQITATEFEKILFSMSEQLSLPLGGGLGILIFGFGMLRREKILNFIKNLIRKSSILRYIGLKILNLARKKNTNK